MWTWESWRWWTKPRAEGHLCVGGWGRGRVREGRRWERRGEERREERQGTETKSKVWKFALSRRNRANGEDRRAEGEPCEFSVLWTKNKRVVKERRWLAVINAAEIRELKGWEQINGFHSFRFYLANGRTDSRGMRRGGLVILIERRKVGWLLKGTNRKGKRRIFKSFSSQWET